MTEGDLITRRRLLAAGGIGAFGITVGAISVYDPTTLRYIGIVNEREPSQTLEVYVEAGGDRVFETSLTVEGGREHEQVPCEWPIPARTYRIGAQLVDESEWSEHTVRGGGDAYRRIRITVNGPEFGVVVPENDPEDIEYIDPCEVPWWVDEFRAESS